MEVKGVCQALDKLKFLLEPKTFLGFTFWHGMAGKRRPKANGEEKGEKERGKGRVAPFMGMDDGCVNCGYNNNT